MENDEAATFLKEIMNIGLRRATLFDDGPQLDINKLATLMIPLLIKEGLIKSEEEFEDFMIGVDVAEKLFPMSGEE